ncbi:hypothetical protein LAROYE_42 [Arthrobacter phage Laroye]|uniref:Uncharacterized protein n=1 Tax=Arthrobacter phage Laroye TaxID=1772305 RepID=A0A0U4JMH3_9CAUD|nr:hypothetical protein FDH64_gp42 [Arthrobacter phage Laroye]ALY09569.1 hypothetical protein LAROYE_42 [Arthrobacter phage Laroye]
MQEIPESFRQIGAKVVILGGRMGADTIVQGVITALSKTRVTVTTKRHTGKFGEDGKAIMEDNKRQFVHPSMSPRGKEVETLDEYGYRGNYWTSAPSLYMEDHPKVAKAREAKKIDGYRKDLIAAIRGFEKGNMSPARAKALRGSLNNYITKMEALEPQAEGTPQNDDV